MAFHVIHYEVKVLLLDLAAKREWYKIIFSNSERVMVQNQFQCLQLYRDEVRTNSDYSICTL